MGVHRFKTGQPGQFMCAETGWCRGTSAGHRKIEAEIRATCHASTLMPNSIGDTEFRFAISGQLL
jgi:hypothetical protein